MDCALLVERMWDHTVYGGSPPVLGRYLREQREVERKQEERIRQLESEVKRLQSEGKQLERTISFLMAMSKSVEAEKEAAKQHSNVLQALPQPSGFAPVAWQNPYAQPPVPDPFSMDPRAAFSDQACNAHPGFTFDMSKGFTG